jgi:predicted amidohydrolase
MKIGVAQTRPAKGNIDINIEGHIKLVGLAVKKGADTIFFPELSITGYEPGLASELATDINDRRLDIFQQISDKNNITIGIGLPTKKANGILITMIIFQPHTPRQAYSKQHLHADEVPFFINGEKQVFIDNDQQKIAPGICYETSLPVHWENAHTQGANIYVASVAKSAAGVERSTKIFSDMAKKYSMTVLLSNSLGPADNFVSAGKSAIWNTKGEMLAQLDDSHEGIIIYDTTTGQATKNILTTI